MKIFLDTADLDEIRRAADAGLVDGITTNPSLISKVAGDRDPKEIYLKICEIVDGLKACRDLRSEGFSTNVTLCFSVSQALLAAKAGATYVSPFVGRIDDISGEGMDLIHQIRQVYDTYGYETQILAASLRNVGHVAAAAVAGSDAATFGADTFKALVKHPLTDKGLDAFVADWAKTGQSIL